MLSNAKMTPNRYGQWAKYRRQYAAIQETFRLGGIVQIVTYTQAREYDARHAGQFKAVSSGLYVQRGKSWDCIMSGPIAGCAIRHWRPMGLALPE